MTAVRRIAMSDTRFVFVVNPRSAAGATLRRFESHRREIAERLKRQGFDLEVRLTERPRHATELARSAVVAGAAVVVAVGGDGTNNEVVNGFFDVAGQRIASTTALGCITSGTGGDFRRTFGWTTNPQDDLERLLRLNRRRIDLGKLECTGTDGQPVSRYFINISSFGLSGVVADIANRSGKRLGAKLSFMMASAQAMATYQAPRVRLTIDDGPTTTENLALGAMCNGQYFGGGMWVAPDAVPDDGLFDAVFVTGGGPAFWLRHGLSVYAGKHTLVDAVRIGRCQTVRAEPDVAGNRIFIDLDGEQPGMLPATWSIVPATVDLLV
jgi:YegS/Rv2252/BmrU family lipid kinase